MTILLHKLYFVKVSMKGRGSEVPKICQRGLCMATLGEKSSAKIVMIQNGAVDSKNIYQPEFQTI